VTPELEAAWTEATEHWDDPKAHERVLELAAIAHALPWIAKHYRAREPDAVSKGQLDRITKMALATMMATAARKPEKESTPYKGVIIVLAVLIMLAIVGLAYASLTAANHADDGPHGPAKPRPSLHHK
jgi:hypothetical protein